METCVDIKAASSKNSHPGSVLEKTTEAFVIERIHQWFEAVAARTPSASAVVFEQRQLNYGELNARANQLAHHLRRQGIGPESIVALRVERSLEMIVGLFGILKAGAAYLPIDPSYPPERQQFMVSDASVQWILAQGHLPKLETTAAVFKLDDDWPQLANESTANPLPINTADDLAYVIYTSGSTGKPKGVQVTHRNLIHSTLARFRFYEEPIRNFLLLSSHAFDSSVAGIFWTLSQGGTLTLPHEFSQQTAFELADLIARHRVSHLLCLPSLYTVLLEQSTALSGLSTVIVAGESCPLALVNRHHALMVGAVLYNEYGPTEATVWSTAFRCEPSAAKSSVPIGKPIPGAYVCLLDEELRLVRNGDVGELHIGGPGIARGYLKRPELTAARFIPDPHSRDTGSRLYKTGDLARWRPDGNLEFLGRADHQIKLRGHRIELEEIEAILKQHEAIQDAVVVAREIPQSRAVESETDLDILQQLTAMNLEAAEQLLADVESKSKPDVYSETNELTRQTPDLEFSLRLKRQEFIRPPRASQRTWLLHRALDEFVDDLRAADALAKRFVPGAEMGLETMVADRTQAELSEQEILEDWHIPLMRAMARGVTQSHGNVLEIGFGRGLASGFIQEGEVRSHTIIECNDSVISRFFEPWRARFAERDIRLVRGKWQEAIGTLGQFDGIFFQTYPLNEREFGEYLARSIVFAEHFFPVAAQHLRPDGCFTYLTHEIDSLSRRHQRLLFQHFKSLTFSVEPLQLPVDCRDLWWADSMVVVHAIK